MSFEKIPALLEQLVSLVTETNKLLTEQKVIKESTKGVETQPTQDAPAPTQSAPEVAPAATVETASASPSEQVAYTEMDAKNAMLDVANKRGRDTAVGCLTKFNIKKFPELDPSKYGEFVAYCKSLVQ